MNSETYMENFVTDRKLSLKDAVERQENIHHNSNIENLASAMRTLKQASKDAEAAMEVFNEQVKDLEDTIEALGETDVTEATYQDIFKPHEKAQKLFHAVNVFHEAVRGKRTNR